MCPSLKKPRKGFGGQVKLGHGVASEKGLAQNVKLRHGNIDADLKLQPKRASTIFSTVS